MPLPRFVLRPLLRLWLRLDVRRAARLDAGPLVYAVRRTGALDRLLLSALLPPRVRLFPRIDRALLADVRAGAACAVDAAAPRAPWLFANAGAPVAPVHIEGLELCRWSGAPAGVPRRLAPKVRVSFGAPERLALAGRGRRRRAEAALAAAGLVEEARRAALDRHPSVPAALADTAAAMGRGRPVLAGPDGEPLSLGRVFLAADALARTLADIPPGERVGLLLPTAPGVAVVLVALWRLGLAPAMLNPTLGPGPLLSCLATVGSSRVVTSRLLVREAKLEPVVEALAAAGIALIWTEELQRRVDRRTKIRAAVSAFAGRARSAKPFPGRAAAGRSDPAVILFTSGTEGAPKGVVLSHGNLLANVAQLRARTDIGPSDRMLASLPVFHSLGLTGGLLLPLVAGARVVTYPNPLHYKAVPELAARRAVTTLVGTDTFLAGWARRAGPEDFATVRAAIVGAEPVKAATRDTWTGGFGVPVLEGYGTTETSPVLALNVAGAERPGTVGRLLPGIEARLEPVPGIAGARLFVRGPNVMLGYIRPEAHGAVEPPPGGWYDTGDAVTVDRDGFVTICGRIKRFAKVGGEMVSLAAVEALAHRTWPGVPAAAIALPDARKGDRVVLALGDETGALDASLGPLRERARAEGIAEIMLPARVVALPALPLLGSGKPDYPGLARLLAAREGAQAAE